MRDGHENTCKLCAKSVYAAWADANRDRLRNYQAQWRAENPDRWKAVRNRARGKFDRTEGGRHIHAKRAAAKAKAKVDLSVVLQRDGRWCHICNSAIDVGHPVHFDHVIPLARGGAHTEENLKPAHPSCNTWKSDRIMTELVGLPRPSAEQRAAYVLALRAAKRGEGRPKPEKRRREPKPKRSTKPWAQKSEAEKQAIREKIREAKRGSPGRPENLRPYTDEDRKIARAALAAKRARGEGWGVPVSDDTRRRLSEALKLAYAEGRRKRGHTEETKRKISATKRRKREQG